MYQNVSSLAKDLDQQNTNTFFWIVSLLSLVGVVGLVFGWKKKLASINFIIAMVVCVMSAINFGYTGSYFSH